MSAHPLRKNSSLSPVTTRGNLASATDASIAHDSPARLRQLQLSAAFDGTEPYVERMPTAARLAILVVASSLAWAPIAGLIGLALAR